MSHPSYIKTFYVTVFTRCDEVVNRFHLFLKCHPTGRTLIPERYVKYWSGGGGSAIERPCCFFPTAVIMYAEFCSLTIDPLVI